MSEWAAIEGARQALAELREALETPEGITVDPAALERRSQQIAAELCRPHPTRVVNATGIVLHTNLGRAPLAPGAAAAVARAAEGYGDLELSLASGVGVAALGQHKALKISSLRPNGLSGRNY